MVFQSNINHYGMELKVVVFKLTARFKFGYWLSDKLLVN
jgi:hypothetical protein